MLDYAEFAFKHVLLSRAEVDRGGNVDHRGKRGHA